MNTFEVRKIGEACAARISEIASGLEKRNAAAIQLQALAILEERRRERAERQAKEQESAVKLIDEELERRESRIVVPAELNVRAIYDDLEARLADNDDKLYRIQQRCANLSRAP